MLFIAEMFDCKNYVLIINYILTFKGYNSLISWFM